MDNSSDELELNICEAEEEVGSPPSTGSGGCGDTKPTHLLAAAPSPPSPKRSRRSVQKRVVSVPISEVDGSRSKGGAGEGAPPSDSWTWRKYGQKPIKGSPYPRGYYRCSSSKGCPARKQVERSRDDPTMIMVTYSFDHNHAWPQTRNHHIKLPPAAKLLEDQSPPSPAPPSPSTHQLITTEPSPPESTERGEKLSDLIGDEESSLMIQAGGFQWFANAASPNSNSPTAASSDVLLYGSVFFSSGGVAEAPEMGIALLPEDRGEETGGGGEDDALFAGLGELPEYSMVFRRGLTSTTAASTSTW